MKDPKKVELSDREQEVIRHCAYGHDTRLTAAAMFISVNTVKTHLRSIAKKTGISNREGIVGYCLLFNLVDRERVRLNYINYIKKMGNQ